ncbi:MAG: ribbon-helix-helix domain-containing protein [Thermoplasmata archaeon]
MRTARADAPATRFLGVRLTTEEEAQLDQYRQRRAFSNRSDAVRALVREAVEERPSGAELPATLRSELEELVEEGYAPNFDGALALAVHAGIVELARTHTERMPALRDHARAASERREGRKRADREGRGFLRR